MQKLELLTIEDVAQLLRVSERTVYDWAQKGQIPCGKIGNVWRFKRGDVEQWINRKLDRPAMHPSPMPIPIADVLTEDRVVFLTQEFKQDVLIAMVDVLAKAPQVRDREALLRQVFSRETLMSTGIGLGIGVPHVRMDGVEDIVMAFGICQRPIQDYVSLDDEPIRLICLIAAHSDQHSKHIKLLASIARRLKSDQIRRAILASRDRAEVIQLFSGAQ